MTTVWERVVNSVYSACLTRMLSVSVCSFYPFGFEDGMWDLIILIPDHCLSICFIISRYLSEPILSLKYVFYGSRQVKHLLTYDTYSITVRLCKQHV